MDTNQDWRNSTMKNAPIISTWKAEKKMWARLFAIVFVFFAMLIFADPFPEAYAAASDYSADEAIAWAKGRVGHSVGYDDGSGYYQCVEFIQAYYEYLGVNKAYGNGCDYASNALPDGWTRTYGGIPQKGDILVYSAYSSTVQQFGHVAIYESDYSLYDQDGSVWGATVKHEEKNYRTYTYNYWGCIHPNFNGGTAAPSFSFENYDKFYELGNDYAHFGTRIYGSVGSAAAVGCELYNANKTLLGSCQDGAYREGDCLIHHFIFQAGSPDINITLTPGTTYFYRYYVVANGKTFPSDYYRFTTQEQTQIGFSFVNNEAYYELGPYSAHFGTKIYGSVSSATNVGCILYNDSKEVLGSCQDEAWQQADYLIHHYYFQEGSSDINRKLTPGTTYYFQYYVIANGERYYSELYSFRTLGTTATIFYNANGGYDLPTNQTFTSTDSSVTATISTSRPSKPGFIFIGWSERSDAAEATYQPGATINIKTNITLYAVWQTTAQVQWQNICCYPFKKSAYISATTIASIPGVFSETGIRVWDKNSRLVAEKTEAGSGSREQLPVWYELYSETGAILQPGEEYTYQLFATFEGKQFASSVYNFTTELPGNRHLGIDVSQAQGNIDWDTVSQYIDFAVIRCGFGGDYTVNDDTQWLNNVTACERLEIPYGVFLYSYAENDDEALDEAEHVLRLLAGHTPALPVYYDLEDANTVGRLSNEQIANQVAIFANRIRKAGFKVGIYANDNWWNSHLSDLVIDNDSKWFAGWSGIYTEQGRNYALWQFTSDGSVPGINGRVDMDYSYLYQFGTIESADPEITEPDFILPMSLTIIGEEAFEGGAFTYARIPEGTTRIERRAFADCPNLTHVYIPESATSIDPTAFSGASSLAIHGKDGSYAEFYASKYGFAFIAE